MMRLNVKAFAATSGLLWGVGIFVFTWWRLLFEKGGSDATIIGEKYPGYSLTPLGSLIGLGWGLVDGAIKGCIFATVYNAIADRIPMKITV